MKPPTAAAADTYPHDLAGPESDAPQAAPLELVTAWREHEALELGQLEDAGPSPLMGAAAGNWRMAGSLQTLLQEADAANPARDKSSDGGVGNLRHQQNWTASDHNPWLIVAGMGVVRARDFDVDGLDVPAAFERLRLAVLAGRLPMLERGGYLIHAERITAADFRSWREYSGPNPHFTHGHVSVSTDLERFDDRRPWSCWAPPSPTAPPSSPPDTTWTGPDLTGSALSLRGDEGNNGPRVAKLQDFWRIRYRLYARDLAVDGVWGPATTAVCREFGQRSRVTTADGRNIGPQLARALYLAGFRG